MANDVMMHRPRELPAVLRLLAEHGETAKPLAGGTAYTILRKAGLLRPEHVVSLHGVPDLDRVEVCDSELRIGSLTTLRSLEQSAEIRHTHAVLAAAAGLVANLRVRNVATIGGNVVEADPTLDLPAVLAAHDAVVHVASADAERDIPLVTFITDYFDTELAPNELVTEVRVPTLPPPWGGSYLKLVSRSTEDRTCVGVAAYANTDAERICRGVRVAAIGVGATPLRLPEIETQAIGSQLDGAALAEIAAAYVNGSDAISDIRGSATYRERMLGTLIPDALRRAMDHHNGAVLL